MQNFKLIGLFIVGFALVSQLSNCKKGSSVKPKELSEILRTVFYAQQVKHDNTIVYSKGAASNTVSGYSKLKIDLSSSSSVAFTDFDGNTFNGTYTLSGSILVFSGLSPVPTGSGGTITFTVLSYKESPTQMVLSRSGTSVKTGNTINEYTLTTTP